MRQFASLAVCVMALVAYSANSITSVDTVALNLARQVYQYPQEKIHITTDKPYYLGGDTIWFRAFVVNAATHEPVHISKYVYVELLNPFEEVIERVKIMEKDGIYSGYIPLSPKISEGNYTLSSYTWFMNSAGEPYFFKKNLKITSPYATQSEIDAKFEHINDVELGAVFTYTDTSSGKQKRYESMSYTGGDGKTYKKKSGDTPIKVKLKNDISKNNHVKVTFNTYSKFFKLPSASSDETYTLYFYPEGGYIVPGFSCKVAFKAVNNRGTRIQVQGTVTDSSGQEITRFESLHAGMGFFTFVPQSGKTYTATCMNDSGKQETFPLPLAKPEAKTLNISYPDKNSFIVSALNCDALENYNIVIHQRGIPVYAGTIEKSMLYLKKSDFPSGIMQVLLLDDSNNLLSERMLFIRNNQSYRVKTNSDKSVYGSRERVSMNLSLEGYNYPEGNYAVTVTDDKSIKPDSICSIESNLLLNSELRGGIEDPGYYFRRADMRTDMELDALLLIQGWRRYDIPEVIKGNYTEPRSFVEIGQEINGTVKSLWKEKPLSGITVNVISPKVGYANTFKTDSSGRFYCTGFNYPDGTKYVIQALNKKGENEMNINIDSFPYPDVKSVSPVEMRKRVALKPNDHIVKNYLTQESKRISYLNGMRNILLEEVTVVRKKYKAPTDIFEALASKSFGYEEMAAERINDMEEVLRKIPGINIIGDNVTFRGGEVAFFIDGIYQEPQYDVIIPHARVNRAYQKARGATGGILFEEVKPISKYSVFKEVCEKFPFDMIKRIDFIRPGDAVVFGSKATVGGALMITTKSGAEYMTWKQPPELVVVTPLGYQKPAEMYMPQYGSTDNYIPEGTDLRNTIYWNPCVKVDAMGISNFDFYTSDVKDTDYTVLIEGITNTGEIINSFYKIKKE